MRRNISNYKYVLIFQLLAVCVLAFHPVKDFNYKYIFYPTILLAVGAVNMFLNTRMVGFGRHYAIVSMIFSIGVVEIFRLSTEYGFKQIFWFCVGSLLMYISYIIIKNIKIFEKMYIYYVAMIFMLFSITLLFGESSGGAKNWIRIFGHLFQPIEIIKILFIFQLSSSPKIYINKINFHFINIALTLIYMGLLIIQKDLGSALILFAILLAYLIIFEKNKKYFLFTLLSFLLAAFIGYKILPHVRVRFNTWLNPFKLYNSTGYQIVTALTSMANGGFTGTGLGLGIPNIIPVNISDMIIACVVEEMGSFMGIAIVLLYLIFTVDTLFLAKYVKNSFYKQLSVLISSFYIMQFMVILLGTLSIIPLTGITAPFLSYGGSSMLSSFIMLGILQASLRVYNE